MSNKNIKDARRAKKRRKKLTSTLIWAGIAVVVLIVIGLIIFDSIRPSEGEAFPIMDDAGAHVPTGEDPGPFNSDPPTSGRHYSDPLDPGFYQADDPETELAYPEGYLLHNLEHGYVIFWYNCEVLDTAQDCDDLKADIQDVMDRFLGVKLIAFPWASIEQPVVLTSWGQMLRLDKFEKTAAREFIQTNRNRAPEPNAP